MNPSLRPMNLGEIFDRSFQIYRARFLAFVGIAAMPVLAWEMIYFAGSTWLHAGALVHPVRQSILFGWDFLTRRANYYAVFGLAFLTEPAIVKLTSSSILGTECSIASSLRFASARWRRYLWISFLVASAGLVIPELALICRAVGAVFFANAAGSLAWQSVGAHPLIRTLGVIIGWSIFLCLLTSLSLAVPVAGLEDLAGFSSLRRSWALTKGTQERILSAILAIWISLWVVTWGSELLLGQLMYFAGGVLHIAAAMRNLYAPAVFVLATGTYALIGPMYPIALTLFYYDQRIRREGFDIEQMMVAAGFNSNAIATADAAAISDEGRA